MSDDSPPVLVVKENSGGHLQAQQVLQVPTLVLGSDNTFASVQRYVTLIITRIPLQATFGGKELTLQLTLEPDDIAPIFDGAAW